jgi:PAS domain S-box-containing protein
MNSVNKLVQDMNTANRNLFEVSPQPSWVYDINTLKFLDVNEAAILHYGYTREEFLNMTLRHIRPPEDIDILEMALQVVRDQKPQHSTKVYRHRKKNGELIDVQVKSNHYSYHGTEAEIVLINDISAIISSQRELQQSKEELAKSEAKWQALVQHGSDMITIMDHNLNYQFASESCTSILGLSPEQFLKGNALDYIHPENHKHVLDQFSQLKDVKRIELDPFRFQDHTGNFRWIKTILTDLSNDPAIRGIVGNSMDVTDSVVSSEELRLSNERYKLVLKASDEAICDWDILNDVVIWGSGFSEIFGYNLEVYNHNLWSENLHPEDRDRVIDELTKSLKNPEKEIYYSEYRFLKANREVVLIQHRGIFLRDEQGRAIRSVDTLKDITAHKERLIKIEKQNEQLKEIAWAQSHHVRAPLARILALSELLKIEKFTSQQQELLDHLYSSATALDDAIKSIIKKTE